MKTPIYTISGFLGAGKTTFVNGLLSQLSGNVKAAIIVNELGEIAIDGRIIEKRDYLLQEITDGCICCTLKARLVDSLISIVEDHAPHFILLETTGVARPKQVVSEFHLKRLSEKVFSKRIISFLDAVIYARVGHKMPIINFQIEDADVIVLNKIDLVEREALSFMRNRLKSFAGGNKMIYETQFSQMEYSVLFPEMRTPEKPMEENLLQNNPQPDDSPPDRPLTHLHGLLDSTEGFATISLEANSPISHDVLTAFFNQHKGGIIRAKGLLKTESGDQILQYSSSGLQMERFKNGLSKSELVIIVRDKDRESVARAIPDVFARRV